MVAIYLATVRGHQANETLNVGCLGTGGRCQCLMTTLATIPGVPITAVCDIWNVRWESTPQSPGSKPGALPFSHDTITLISGAGFTLSESILIKIELILACHRHTDGLKRVQDLDGVTMRLQHFRKSFVTVG